MATAKKYEDNYYDSKGNVIGTYVSDGKGVAYDKATGTAMRDLYGDSNVQWNATDKPNEKGLYGTITVNTPAPKATASSSGGSSSSSSSWTPSRTSVRDAADIAKTYGDITYDEEAIRNLFDKATNEKYDMLNKEYLMSEGKYFDNLAGTGATLLDSNRRAASAAVATGASRGMQFANELAAMQGLSQQGVADATELVQERNKLTDKHAAELAQNATEAMQYANQTKFNIGNLSSNLYAADTQFDVGQMDYYARLDTAQKALEGQMAMAEAQKYAARLGLSGTEYNAFMNLVGQAYGSNMNYMGNMGVANTNKEASQYAADKNLEGVKYNADQYAHNAGGAGGGYQQPQQQPIASDLLNQAVKSGNYQQFMYLMMSVNPNLSIAQIGELWKNSQFSETDNTQNLEKGRLPVGSQGGAPPTTIDEAIYRMFGPSDWRQINQKAK